MRLMTIGATALLLAGCMTATPTPQKQIEFTKLNTSQVKSLQLAVKSGMKDPESAKFGSYISFETTDDNGQKIDVVCGYVNGKNSYGGYVGMTPYIALGADRKFVTAIGPTKGAMNVCKKQYGVSL